MEAPRERERERERGCNTCVRSRSVNTYLSLPFVDFSNVPLLSCQVYVQFIDLSFLCDQKILRETHAIVLRLSNSSAVVKFEAGILRTSTIRRMFLHSTKSRHPRWFWCDSRYSANTSLQDSRLFDNAFEAFSQRENDNARCTFSTTRSENRRAWSVRRALVLRSVV